jgi:hypothetical protein
MEVDCSGRLTAGSVAQLYERMPNIDWATRIEFVSGGSFLNLLTANLLAEIVYFSQTSHQPASSA